MIGGLLSLATLLVAGATGLPEGVELPIRVACAVMVVDVDGIDEAESRFEATFDVVERWRNPAAGFDRVAAGTDRRELTGAAAEEALASMWSPGLTVRNIVGEPESREVGLRVYADGRVEYVQRLHGTFAMQLDLSRFPFDEQALPIELASPVHSAREVVLVHTEADNERSGIRPGLALPEWTIDDLRFEGGEFRGWNGTAYSELRGAVVATRRATAYIPSLFAPLFVILLLPLLCLWIKTDVHERVNWVVTALFALIALNFSVSLEYPALGIESTFMRLFWYGYALQGVILLIILLFFNESSFSERLGEDAIDEIVSYLAWGVPLLFGMAVADVMLTVAT